MASFRPIRSPRFELRASDENALLRPTCQRTRQRKRMIRRRPELLPTPKTHRHERTFIGSVLTSFSGKSKNCSAGYLMRRPGFRPGFQFARSDLTVSSDELAHRDQDSKLGRARQLRLQWHVAGGQWPVGRLLRGRELGLARVRLAKLQWLVASSGGTNRYIVDG